MIEASLAVTTHGRYLVEPAGRGAPAPLLVGFHGYAESADIQMDRLRAIAGSDRWTIVSIQGLHRFYDRRANTVVASWMTRQDREQAIADNLAYVRTVVDDVWNARHGSRGIVFAGFSQGVAMTFRAAATSLRPVLGVIAVGGDVPPERTNDELGRMGHALIMRGARDQPYPASQFEQDQVRLRDAGVDVTSLEFDGGHEWSEPVLAAATSFLSARLG